MIQIAASPSPTISLDAPSGRPVAAGAGAFARLLAAAPAASGLPGGDGVAVASGQGRGSVPSILVIDIAGGSVSPVASGSDGNALPPAPPLDEGAEGPSLPAILVVEPAAAPDATRIPLVDVDVAADRVKGRIAGKQPAGARPQPSAPGAEIVSPMQADGLAGDKVPEKTGGDAEDADDLAKEPSVGTCRVAIDHRRPFALPVPAAETSPALPSAQTSGPAAALSDPSPRPGAAGRIETAQAGVTPTADRTDPMQRPQPGVAPGQAPSATADRRPSVTETAASPDRDVARAPAAGRSEIAAPAIVAGPPATVSSTTATATLPVPLLAGEGAAAQPVVGTTAPAVRLFAAAMGAAVRQDRPAPGTAAATVARAADAPAVALASPPLRQAQALTAAGIDLAAPATSAPRDPAPASPAGGNPSASAASTRSPDASVNRPVVSIASPAARPPDLPPAHAPSTAATAAVAVTSTETSPAAQPARSVASDAVARLLTPLDTVGPLATTGNDQPSLDLADHRWPAAMVDQIERLRDAADATSTRIRVVPDALGGIDVSLSRHDDGAVQVRLDADQPATRALLADTAPELTRLAEARGIRLATAPSATDWQGSRGSEGGNAQAGWSSSGQGQAQGQGSPQGQQRQPAAPARLATPFFNDTAEAAEGRIA